MGGAGRMTVAFGFIHFQTWGGLIPPVPPAVAHGCLLKGPVRIRPPLINYISALIPIALSLLDGL